MLTQLFRGDCRLTELGRNFSFFCSNSKHWIIGISSNAQKKIFVDTKLKSETQAVRRRSELWKIRRGKEARWWRVSLLATSANCFAVILNPSGRCQARVPAGRHFHIIRLFFTFHSNFIIYHFSQLLPLIAARLRIRKKQKFWNWQKSVCLINVPPHTFVVFCYLPKEEKKMTQKEAEKVSEKHFGWWYQRLMGRVEAKRKFMEIFKVPLPANDVLPFDAS